MTVDILVILMGAKSQESNIKRYTGKRSTKFRGVAVLGQRERGVKRKGNLGPQCQLWCLTCSKNIWSDVDGHGKWRSLYGKQNGSFSTHEKWNYRMIQQSHFWMYTQNWKQDLKVLFAHQCLWQAYSQYPKGGYWASPNVYQQRSRWAKCGIYT